MELAALFSEQRVALHETPSGGIAAWMPIQSRFSVALGGKRFSHVKRLLT